MTVINKAMEIVRKEGIYGIITALGCKINHDFKQKFNDDFNRSGVDIFEKDWDNLIILDACRYDYFSDLNSLPGTLSKQQSKAGTSSQFIRANFKNKNLNDVVYISDNPWYQMLKSNLNCNLFKYIDIREEREESSRVDNAATGNPVTHPSNVTEIALKYHYMYPNKRIIVHYFQPHEPYIDGNEINSKYDPASFVRRQILSGDYTRIELIEMYRKNLSIAMTYVSRLIEGFNGKTVVTADHGELLFERDNPIPVRRFGHENKNYAKKLIQIPWLVYEGEDRKIIKEQKAEDDINSRTEDVEERLNDLGYM